MAKPKVSMRNTANPFAHMESMKKEEEEKKKAAAAMKRKDAKEEVRMKSWIDYPISGMKYVGDYLRGVNTK